MRHVVLWLIQSDTIEPVTDVFPSFAISTEIFLCFRQRSPTHIHLQQSYLHLKVPLQENQNL